jgi:hypothetical protein
MDKHQYASSPNFENGKFKNLLPTRYVDVRART